MKTFEQWAFQQLDESFTSKYSVEANCRTTVNEMLEGFAKISLGYVSAILKGHDLHVKQVYDEKPIRILVSQRNWDDGEWTVVVSWNPEHYCFMISKGFYNKDRTTVSVQSTDKCSGNSAAAIARNVLNMLHAIKNQPNRHQPKLKPVPLKTGPK